MFTVTYKGFDVACETALDAVEFIDTADKPSPGSRARITAPTTTTRATKPRKPRKPKRTKTKPDRAEKDKRNAKARAAYLEKHPEKTQATTTTSRLEALPSPPKRGRGRPTGGSRARTSQAVIDTLKRSPSPLTLDEIDTDLEKSGWPYKGSDRKGAIRATLARLKANGTVSVQKRGTGLETIQMFRLERTNGETPTPVEQVVLNGKEGFTQEERAEVEDSEAEAAAAEAAAESDPGQQRDYL